MFVCLFLCPFVRSSITVVEFTEISALFNNQSIL